jgi:transposase
MFRLWQRVRDGTVSRADFQIQVEPIRTRVRNLLCEGATLSHEKTRHTCENILKLEAALWTFVYVEGVEPTNNHAERCLRRAVLWRRRSFGTQSEAGSRLVERILTTVTTLRQQKRAVLDFLAAACAAAIRGDKPPLLLPESSST